MVIFLVIRWMFKGVCGDDTFADCDCYAACVTRGTGIAISVHVRASARALVPSAV